MTAKVKTIEVTLKKPHTHKGQPCIKGEKITVTETKAQWLHEQGVATKPATAATKESN